MSGSGKVSEGLSCGNVGWGWGWVVGWVVGGLQSGNLGKRTCSEGLNRVNGRFALELNHHLERSKTNSRREAPTYQYLVIC